MPQFQGHQGDILISEVAAIPDAAKPVKTDGVIYLAYGETTGHSHHVVGHRAVMFRDDGTGGGNFLRVSKPVPLDHGVVGKPETADHGSVILPTGVYEVIRQSEWSDEHEPRQVED